MVLKKRVKKLVLIFILKIVVRKKINKIGKFLKIDFIQAPCI